MVLLACRLDSFRRVVSCGLTDLSVLITAGEEPRVPVDIRTAPSTAPGTVRWLEDTRAGPAWFGGMMATCVAGALLVGIAVPAGAVPPPPDNPSDEQIQDSQQQAAASAAEVGRLAGLVSKTEGDIERLKNDMELKAELANKAAVDLQVAQSDAAAADRPRQQAQADADAAGKAVVDAKAEGRRVCRRLVPAGIGARLDERLHGCRQRRPNCCSGRNCSGRCPSRS